MDCDVNKAAASLELLMKIQPVFGCDRISKKKVSVGFPKRLGAIFHKSNFRIIESKSFQQRNDHHTSELRPPILIIPKQSESIRAISVSLDRSTDSLQIDCLSRPNHRSSDNQRARPTSQPSKPSTQHTEVASDYNCKSQPQISLRHLNGRIQTQSKPSSHPNRPKSPLNLRDSEPSPSASKACPKKTRTPAPFQNNTTHMRHTTGKPTRGFFLTCCKNPTVSGKKHDTPQQASERLVERDSSPRPYQIHVAGLLQEQISWPLPIPQLGLAKAELNGNVDSCFVQNTLPEATVKNPQYKNRVKILLLTKPRLLTGSQNFPAENQLANESKKTPDEFRQSSICSLKQPRSCLKRKAEVECSMQISSMCLSRNQIPCHGLKTLSAVPTSKKRVRFAHTELNRC
jgi:hypothetical protein